MTGVDFPRVSLNQAWWDLGRGELSLQTVGQNEAVEGTPTTFRISRVGDPTRWGVNRSTEAPVLLRAIGSQLEVTCHVGAPSFSMGPRT